MPTDADIIDVARNDYGVYLAIVTHDWTSLAPHQVDIARRLTTHGPDSHIGIAAAPSSGKTDILIHYIMWCLGRAHHGLDSTYRVGYASYGTRLPYMVSRRIRSLLVDPTIQSIWPDLKMEPGAGAVGEWRLKGNPYKDPSFVATSIGGSAIGYHWDVAIIDDPVKSLAEARSEAYRDRVVGWYSAVWSTRGDPGCRYVTTHQRWRPDDLLGQLSSAGVPLYSYPAEVGGTSYWPDRITDEWLAEQRDKLGEQIYSAMYLQQPTPVGGVIVDPLWIQRTTYVPSGPGICSWDLAVKAGANNDYSAAARCVLHNDTIYVVDAWRGRLNHPDLLQQICNWARTGDIIGIEDVSGGSAAIQHLTKRQQLTSNKVIATRPGGVSKVDRLTAISDPIRSGQVVFVEGNETIEAMIDEITTMPDTRYDDLCDAAVYGISYLLARGGQPTVTSINTDAMLAMSPYGQL